MTTIKDIEEINEGIRTLHHAVGAIYKLDAYGKKPEASRRKD